MQWVRAKSRKPTVGGVYICRTVRNDSRETLRFDGTAFYRRVRVREGGGENLD